MSRGINRERQVRRLMEADGYWTTRSAGSLGDADVTALKARAGGGTTAVMVEVKSTKAGPFHSFGPADRAELIEAAVKTGATPVLCWWPSRAQPTWIPVKDWPATRDEVA